MYNFQIAFNCRTSSRYFPKTIPQYFHIYILYPFFIITMKCGQILFVDKQSVYFVHVYHMERELFYSSKMHFSQIFPAMPYVLKNAR